MSVGSVVYPLAGKVALVTGAGSGIGRAAALAFAQAGARVVVADVDVAGGQETVHVLSDGGHEAIFVRTDVSRANEVAALIDQAVATFGRLDCAHNNAGILGDRALLADQSETSWDQVMAVNLKGVWLCMKYEIEHMVQQGGGVIVNTASVAGLIGSPDLPLYAASKHGVIGLTKAAARGYAKDGIRVNAICPGFVNTPMVALYPEGASRRIERTPLGRLGAPEEVAGAAVWLCTDAAAFITGHPLVMDGGLMV